MNKIALVTGVGKFTGLGYEVCRQLADRGITTLLTARRAAAAEELARRLVEEKPNREVHAYALDVTRPADIQQLADQVYRRFGRLHILIHNAAEFGPSSEQATHADLSAARRIFDTNLFGAWQVTQLFLPLLRRSRAGRLVMVSSGAGSFGDTRYGLASGTRINISYAISKTALNALNVRLAAEERSLGSGVLVNAVCPGWVATFPGAAERGARPVAEGAAGIVWAATLPDHGPTGGFFRDGKPLPW